MHSPPTAILLNGGLGWWVKQNSSMGGQQLLEWAIEEPELFEYIFPIATNAEHSSWGIAFNASQRMCIENDPTWKDENVDAGLEGMKIARSIALISYRHYEAYSKSQQGFTIETEGARIDRKVFKAETYQRYQGEKLAKRFNAFSYYVLSKGTGDQYFIRYVVSYKRTGIAGCIYSKRTAGSDRFVLWP